MFKGMENNFYGLKRFLADLGFRQEVLEGYTLIPICHPDSIEGSLDHHVSRSGALQEVIFFNDDRERLRSSA